MKEIITDSKTCYVHYIANTRDIYGTYLEINKPLASIEDVINHHEIWNCPLVVREGLFKFNGKEYFKVKE